MLFKLEEMQTKKKPNNYKLRLAVEYITLRQRFNLMELCRNRCVTTFVSQKPRYIIISDLDEEIKILVKLFIQQTHDDLVA